MVNKLKAKRIEAGYTQAGLSEVSGVNIKSIASYEQNGQKLNNASAITVLHLADSLGCVMEDLIDRTLVKK